MAGQGLNLGLLDSSILANVLCKAIHDGKDYSLEDVLIEYEKRAKMNNYSMQAGLEAIKTAYSLNNPLVTFGRNLGVDFVRKTPLKSIFQEFANGTVYSDNNLYWKS